MDRRSLSFERSYSGRADRAALIEWEISTFEVFRRRRELVTVVDHLLPDEPLLHLDEARPVFELLG